MSNKNTTRQPGNVEKIDFGYCPAAIVEQPGEVVKRYVPAAQVSQPQPTQIGQTQPHQTAPDAGQGGAPPTESAQPAVNADPGRK